MKIVSFFSLSSLVGLSEEEHTRTVMEPFVSYILVVLCSGAVDESQ